MRLMTSLTMAFGLLVACGDKEEDSAAEEQVEDSSVEESEEEQASEESE